MSWLFGFINESLNKLERLNKLEQENQELRGRVAALEKKVSGAASEPASSSQSGSGGRYRGKVYVDVFTKKTSSFPEFQRKFLARESAVEIRHREQNLPPLDGERPAETALLVTYSPSDRWLDNLDQELVESLKGRYSCVIVLMEKPLSDPEMLKTVTDFRGFASVFQICVTTKLDLIETPHNEKVANDLIATLTRR